jgi:hypothetical protein
MREQPFVSLFPVQLPCLFLKGVIRPAIAKQVALFMHFAPVIALWIHVGPNRNHQAGIQSVEFVNHSLWIRKAFWIESLLPPQVLRP